MAGQTAAEYMERSTDVGLDLLVHMTKQYSSNAYIRGRYSQPSMKECLYYMAQMGEPRNGNTKAKTAYPL